MAEETATGVAEVWRGHVRAWQQSAMSRTAYCLEHGLDVRRFHYWVGRLRGEFRRPVGQRPRRGRSTERPGPRHAGAGGVATVGACEGGGAAVTAGDGEPAGFVPVTVIDEAASPPVEERPPETTEGAEGRPGGTIEVFMDGVVVRLTGRIAAGTLRAVLLAVRATA